MRILASIAMAYAWGVFISLVMQHGGLELSADAQWLSIAIVFAGMLAGGDD